MEEDSMIDWVECPGEVQEDKEAVQTVSQRKKTAIVTLTRAVSVLRRAETGLEGLK